MSRAARPQAFAFFANRPDPRLDRSLYHRLADLIVTAPSCMLDRSWRRHDDLLDGLPGPSLPR
jgi:hypothetical protein